MSHKTGKDGNAETVELTTEQYEAPMNKLHEIQDADDALKIMHTHYEPFTPAEERSVLRKIDLRLALLMTLVNGIQFVDKLTIAQAATYGLIKQAHLQGQEFSLLISLFYIGYLVAQYPANLLMQKYPIGKVITINFLLWGIVLASTGACTTFGSLAACRFLLGVFESCLNPGFVLITSSWWKRSEQPFRTAIWYCANGLSSIPAGLAFYGIAHLHARGLFPYQWMFIIFGSFTILVGISLWWLLPDSPTTVSWLSERERIIAVERLKENKTGIKNSQHKAEQVKEALKDIKVWLLVLAVFVHNMTNSLQTSFQGLIIKGFGYNTYQTVLLSMVGPSILVVVMLVVMYFLSTKYGQEKRLFAMMILYLPGIVAGVILYVSPIKPSTKGLHLFAIFIIPIVAVAAGILYSLLASNVAGYTKKTISGSLFFTSYCVANIISPLAWLTKQAPKYTTGVAVSLACFCLNIIVFGVLYVLYARANKKRDGDIDAQVSTDDTKDLIESFSDLTDLQNKKFRYTK